MTLPPVDWQAVGLTLRLSLCTSVLLLVLGLPLAHWLAFSKWRGRGFVEAVVALPLVLPPSVLGFYLLVLLGSHSPIGKAWLETTGRSLAFSFEGLLIASVIYSLPFAVQPFTAGFRSVRKPLIEAAWCLGRSRPRTFLSVVLPLAWSGVLAGIVLSFAHTLGEFGVVLMVGGNIAGVTRTVSISIYDSVQAMDYASAGWTAGLLLLASFFFLSITYALQGHFRIGAWNKD